MEMGYVETRCGHQLPQVANMGSVYTHHVPITSGSTPPTSKMFRTHIAPETLVKCMETLHFGAHMVPFIVIRG